MADIMNTNWDSAIIREVVLDEGFFSNRKERKSIETHLKKYARVCDLTDKCFKELQVKAYNIAIAKLKSIPNANKYVTVTKLSDKNKGLILIGGKTRQFAMDCLSSGKDVQSGEKLSELYDPTTLADKKYLIEDLTKQCEEIVNNIEIDLMRNGFDCNSYDDRKRTGQYDIVMYVFEVDRSEHQVDLIDEGAVKTALGAGVVAGVGAGIYDGIKRHRLEKIDREEKAMRWTGYRKHLADEYRDERIRADRIRRAKQDAELAKYRKMERDYYNDTDSDEERGSNKKKHLKLQLVREDISDPVNEGTAAKAIGLAAVGYLGYKGAKGITSAITKKIIDDKELAEYEHERAFQETPEETARRLKSKLYRKNGKSLRTNENVGTSNTLSKVW